MTFYKKPERDWHDPPIDKKISLSGLFSKKWILISLCIYYPLTLLQILVMDPDLFQISMGIVAATVMGVLFSPIIEFSLKGVF